jgi:uncharacterized membrane protein YphA (DoxX/SURF4 family)
MANPLHGQGSTSLGLLAARVPLGVYFVIAGFNKLAGDSSLKSFVDGNIGSVPNWFPEALGQAYLYSLPFAEIIVGLALVLGLFGRFAGLLASLMLASFIIAITGIKHEKLPFQPNAIFLGTALLVMLAGPGGISVDQMIWGKGKAKKSSSKSDD